MDVVQAAKLTCMRKVFWFYFGGLVPLVFLTGVYIISTLQFRFGGYDLSPLIDSGWRVLSGQVPNRDFICTFPPLLFLGVAFAFRVFGVHWIALSLASICYTTGIILLGFRILFLLRRRLGDGAAIGLMYGFAALEFLPVLVVGHPWHSSWTEDAVLYAVLTTFAVGLSTDSAFGVRTEFLIHLGFAETLLLLGKPNMALPALVICTITLLLRPHRWRPALVPLSGAVVLASLLLVSVRTNLITTYRVYLQLSSRLGADGGFGDLFGNPFVQGGLPDLAVYIAVLPAFVWSLLLASRCLRHTNLAWIGVLALGTSLLTFLGLGTNVEFRLVDVGCLLLGVALLGTLAPSTGRRFLGGVLAQAIVSLVVIGLFYSETRARMRAVGVWGDDSCGSLIEHRDRFFGAFHACSGFFDVLQATDKALEAHRTARVFFGPRMEFLYAREDLQSPKQLPLWWHPGSSFPKGQVLEIAKAWEDARFEVLVFLAGDRTRVPQRIVDDIARDYVQLPRSSESRTQSEARIDVYVRR